MDLKHLVIVEVFLKTIVIFDNHLAFRFVCFFRFLNCFQELGNHFLYPGHFLKKLTCLKSWFFINVVLSVPVLFVISRDDLLLCSAVFPIQWIVFTIDELLKFHPDFFFASWAKHFFVIVWFYVFLRLSWFLFSF